MPVSLISHSVLSNLIIILMYGMVVSAVNCAYAYDMLLQVALIIGFIHVVMLCQRNHYERGVVLISFSQQWVLGAYA